MHEARVWSLIAFAATVFEYPGQGSEALGRGGAWVARASDPMAIARNPAGLVGQRPGVTAGWDIAIRHVCFARTKAANDPTEDSGAYPRVCDDSTPIPVGYAAITIPISPRFALGAGVLTPSGVGRLAFPTFTNGEPAPQRYSLIESTTLMAIPTLAGAYSIVPNFRIGLALGWGIAWVRTAAAAPSYIVGAVRPADGDVKVEATAFDAFVPRATLGAHWIAAPHIEVGASLMWSDDIAGSGSARTEANAFTPRAAAGDTSRVWHGDGGTDHLTVPLPPTATLGARVRIPASARRGDPLADERADIEFDATWNGDSAIQRIGLGFAPNTPVAGTAGKLPLNADSERRYRDTVTFHAGGDLVLVPGHFAVRAGTFFTPRAAIPGDAGLEAIAGQRIGLAAGATMRMQGFDLSVAYLHEFIADLTTGSTGISATAGQSPFRTPWPINLGRTSDALNVIHAGISYRL